MSKYYDQAVALRAITEPHYNCAQAVAIPFAEGAGINEQVAKNIAANFGAGMKRAATCGAITGGLMVLGMYGVEEPAIIGEYYRRLRESHNNFLDCANLLKINKENGGEKKPHCDALVYECVKLAEEILREQGKIKS